MTTATRPATLAEAAGLFGGGEPLADLYDLEFEPGVEQRALIAHTLRTLDSDERLALFPGAAGTGKSTTLLVLLQVLEDCGLRVDVAAPTWKAAARAEECLGDDRRVVTLHSVVYQGAVELVDFKCDACGVVERMPGDTKKSTPCEAIRTVDGEDAAAGPCTGLMVCVDEFADELVFGSRDPGTANVGDVLILDESSMIGADFAAEMWLALPEWTKVIAIGDPHQLPPVMEKSGFPLHEAEVTLSHVYRQAEASPVLKAATLIREERVPFTWSRCGADWQRGDQILKKSKVPTMWMDSTGAGNMLAKLYRRNDGDACAIVGTHRTRVALNDACRSALQLPPRGNGPAIGERLICRRGGARLRNADLIHVQKVEPVKFDERFGPGWVVRYERQERQREIAVLKATWDGDCAPKHRGLIPRTIRETMKRMIDDDRRHYGEEIQDQVDDRARAWKARTGEHVEKWLRQIWEAEIARDLGAWAIYLAMHLASVDTGYAITCHAAQGSQYQEIVVVADCVDFIAEDDPDDVYRWSYTALTRAVQMAYIVKKKKGGWE